MSILWAGGEDIDFAAGAVLPVAANIGTTAGYFRAGYARCAIGGGISTTPSATFLSQAFAGGPVTSCWLSFRLAQITPESGFRVGNLLAGLVQSGTAGSGIYLLIDGTGSWSNRLAIATFLSSGPTITQLASESGTSLASGVPLKIDIQVVSYGATGTINVFSNGVLIITYSGNIAVSGVTGLDTVATAGAGSPFANQTWNSEFVVANEDTRTFSVATLAPAGAGTTDAWTGVYTDVNELVINDATAAYTNTATQDEEFTLTSLPSGIITVRAIQIAARSAMTSGATADKIAAGVRSGGTTSPGTAQALTTSWVTLQSLLSQNPVTSANWAVADVNALQLNFRSST
jgi:hypothetical protein